ncbi:MAG: tetratricopeptide repeat protein [Anaerolineae bacterium]|nr:tetratricopeptide repeat protein [Anaerolineae bacterium]
MISISISLPDILFNPTQAMDWQSLTEEETLLRLGQIYSFLPAPLGISISGQTATIESPFDSQDNARNRKLFAQAAAEAGRGRYHQALTLLKQFLEKVPDSGDGRRNLGMVYLEMGQVELAEKHLLEAYYLDPHDAHTLLLLGNIYLDKKQDETTGEWFYQRAIKVNPNDPYVLSNMAGMLARREDYSQAQHYFRQAIQVAPAYPHAYYGLALTQSRQGETQAALTTLDALFAQPESMDIRTEPVYAEARRLYGQINHTLAQESQESSMAYIHQWRDELEKEGGVEIEIVQDNRIDNQAVAQIAWHDRSRHNHIIRYRHVDALLVPHLLAHELQHIVLEQNARALHRNRFFRTTDETWNNATNAIGRDINDLKRKGLLGDQLDAFTQRILRGMVNQIFNAPLDMVIEYFLHQQHPQLRPHQYLSLQETHKENRQVLTQPDLKKLTPRLIYNGNVSLNAAYALFTDHLLGSTHYAADYADAPQMRTGRQLFGLWQACIQDFQPGDEFDLVDEFAALLKMPNFYEWQPDEELSPEEGGGSTNPELLKSKEMASVMYCLSALQRFEKMTGDEILKIIAEIAIIGQTGLDYASPEQKYHLASLPGETFSGLQLMCLMYVGFKDIQPTVDVGMDLSEPYQMALKLHREGDE